jgi:alanyl-tRNA synthetase
VRQATALNHSATHLLHAALRQVLGDHVAQKGSLVDAQKLRFDFSHFEALSAGQLQQVERLVNEQVRLNTPVETTVTSMDHAKDLGAMMLFGEKYGDEVRVLSMGEGYSVELCGGTHVKHTGDIGLLKIISEAGVAAGVRRIEALTGELALQACNQTENTLWNIAGMVKGSRENVSTKVQQLLASNKQLEKELAQLKAKLASSAGTDLAGQAEVINGIKVLSVALEGVDGKSLRDTLDQLKNKLGSAVIMLAAVEGEKISLTAGVTNDLTSRFKAGDLMREVAGRLGGKGGGRPDMAQGGGTDRSVLPEALAYVKEWVQDK